MDAEEHQHLEDLLRSYQRRLRLLERQRALFGPRTPPEVLIEIEDIQVEITHLETSLGHQTSSERESKQISTTSQDTAVDVQASQASAPSQQSINPQLAPKPITVKPASKSMKPTDEQHRQATEAYPSARKHLESKQPEQFTSKYILPPSTTLSPLPMAPSEPALLSVEADRILPRVEFKYRRTKVIAQQLIGVLIIFAGIGLLLVSVISLSTEARYAKYIEGYWIFIYISVIGGVAFLLLGTWIYLKGLRKQNILIRIFSDRLEHRQNDKITTFRWSEIKEEWKLQNEIRIYRDDNAVLTFSNDFQNIKELDSIIQNEILKRHLSKAITELNAGKSLTFGKMNITPKGLAINQGTFPWWEIEDIGYDAITVWMRKRGVSTKYPIAKTTETPNIMLFKELSQRILDLYHK